MRSSPLFSSFMASKKKKNSLSIFFFSERRGAGLEVVLRCHCGGRLQAHFFQRWHHHEAGGHGHGGPQTGQTHGEIPTGGSLFGWWVVQCLFLLIWTLFSCKYYIHMISSIKIWVKLYLAWIRFDNSIFFFFLNLFPIFYSYFLIN